LTNLSTLLANSDLQEVASGTEAVVLGTDKWRSIQLAMTPERDVDRATVHVRQLANTALDTAIKTGWCSRLRGRSGLFEVRVNGVRFYGGQIGTTTGSNRPLLVLTFVGAEHKGGRQASAAVLDEAEAVIEALRRRVELAEQAATVTSLASRSGRSHMKGRKT
jgi:hypothetical protein